MNTGFVWTAQLEYLAGFGLMVVLLAFALGLPSILKELARLRSGEHQPGVDDEQNRIRLVERELEALAIEIERLGESQRYLMRLIDRPGVASQGALSASLPKV
jgi:hypothetical protein